MARTTLSLGFVLHKAGWARGSQQKTPDCSLVSAVLGWAQSQMKDTEMELTWQMRSSDSSSRPFAGPGAFCNIMNAPLPPFYLHSRLLLQHPFRRSLLAARRQGVHSGWCMPSLKDTQGSHTNCSKGTDLLETSPVPPAPPAQDRGDAPQSDAHLALLPGRRHPFANPILDPDAKLGPS